MMIRLGYRPFMMCLFIPVSYTHLEENGLTARIYPEQAVVEAKALDTEMIRLQLQAFLDEYNKNQPTYRRITGLVIRKNPFIRSTTKKIRRQDVLIDEPQA